MTSSTAGRDAWRISATLHFVASANASALTLQCPSPASWWNAAVLYQPAEAVRWRSAGRSSITPTVFIAEAAAVTREASP